MIPFLFSLLDLSNMKKIILTQDQVAIVDDDFYEYLNQWKWYYSRSGYAVRTSKNSQVLMHRQIMCMVGSARQIDHINKDKLDNRKSNLRVCNDSLNQANTSKKSTNTSGYKGVSLNKQTGKWTAQITVNKSRIHLGYFNSPKEAAEVYDRNALQYFGEFAELNFS